MNMNFKEPHALPEKSYQGSACIFVKLKQAFCFALLPRVTARDGLFTGVSVLSQVCKMFLPPRTCA